MSLVTTTILIYSLFALPVDSLEREVLGIMTRHTLLRITALAAASPILFTLLVMAPGLVQLRKVVAADIKGDDVSGSGVQTDGLIYKWFAQHNVRCWMFFTAFIGAFVDILAE
ncbi:hypothetical protein DL96DRAFT_1677972 [Flagelloscypha sp. PMI_526]|nr:hypothetical protein DL96DRAFT_1677972 [Flagelloscypha sp. PMI_526]